jgi:cytochrome o ubiquinol oxidase operon protein cyoD
MSHDPLMDPPHPVEYGNLRSYCLGFLFSIVFTVLSYYLVVEKWVTGWALDGCIAILAIVQATFQLILFLNLFREPRPRWNLIIFLFMLMVIVIVVAGSVWIMNNLNYNLMGK